MGYPTKVQVIQRKTSEQWYVNLPAAVAHVFEFQKGEQVEWTMRDRQTLVLTRGQASAGPARKKKR